MALAAVSAQAEPPVKRVGAEVRILDHEDVSPPLRSLKPIPPAWPELQEKEEHEVKRWSHHHPVHPLGTRPDPLASFQNRFLIGGAAGSGALTPAPMVAATAGLNFDGVGVPNYTVSGAPPDTVGAVGSTQYVQWVNTAFAVYNKSNGALVYGPANGSTLWQGFGGRCETDNSGDPLVAYDQLANRWVMSQFAVSASPYFQCIAVSTDLRRDRHLPPLLLFSLARRSTTTARSASGPTATTSPTTCSPTAPPWPAPRSAPTTA